MQHQLNYKKEMETIKANIRIGVDNLTAATRFMSMYKKQGAQEIRDKETRSKGGRKYELNGEIVYIFLVR